VVDRSEDAGAMDRSEDAGAMDRLAALLDSRYGLAVERLEPAPRGWTGETFIADIHSQGRVFVKVYPKERLPPTAAAALSALAEMHRLGMAELSRPIPTTSGALHARLGDDLVVVFEYLDAVQYPFTFGGERLGDLIARVHQQTERVASPIARETFEPPYADELARTLARARQEPASDELRRGLRRYLDGQAAAIADGWAAFGEIARACRAARLELVLTHGDWPFNLLQSADGAIHLIDWDELLLAPAERDTWFAGAEPAFWRGYRLRRAGQAESGLATAYYVHNRYFEELLGFSQDVLGHDAPERRATALALLGGSWMAGLRARMEEVDPAAGPG
jgi:spectinomycin phosphotransferase